MSGGIPRWTARHPACLWLEASLQPGRIARWSTTETAFLLLNCQSVTRSTSTPSCRTTPKDTQIDNRYCFNLTVSAWLLAQSYNTLSGQAPFAPASTRQFKRPNGHLEKIKREKEKHTQGLKAHSYMWKLPHGHPQPGLVQAYMWWHWFRWQGLCLQYKWWTK